MPVFMGILAESVTVKVHFEFKIRNPCQIRAYKRRSGGSIALSPLPISLSSPPKLGEPEGGFYLITTFLPFFT